MLQLFVSVLVTVVVIALRIASRLRKLAGLDEHAGNAMAQIGMQLCDRCDLLTDLLAAAKGFDRKTGDALIERMGLLRTEIAANSTPDDVLRQEEMIAEILAGISALAETHPELRNHKAYTKSVTAILAMENMMRTSRMIYNDSVTKLNREIRKFPLNLIARLAGIRRRDYMEERPRCVHSDDADRQPDAIGICG